MQKIKQKMHDFLRWSEKYTKTDMVYLTRGGFWLTANSFITAPLVFITAVIFANRIPAQTYGTYKFLLSTLGILAITVLSGMGPILAQAVARGFEGSFFTALKTKITWGLFGSLASIIISIYYYANGNTTLSLAFLIASVFIPFMDSLNIYQDYLQGKKLFKDSSVSYSVSQLVAVLIMISTLFLTKNLFIIFSVYLSSWTLIRLFFFLRTVKRYPPNNKVDAHTIPYGKQSSFIDFLATIISSIDQILIFHYLGAVELAFFTFAIAPVSQLISLSRNIYPLAMPKMAARPIKEIDELLHKRIFTAFLVSLCMIGFYFLISPFIYHIFFPKYLGSVGLSRVYAFAMLFAIPSSILGPAINSKVTNLPKKMLYFWNIPGILSTIFIFLFINKIGVVSVVLARIILVFASFTVGIGFWRYIVKKDKKLNPSPDTI
jgi:O-antigen/teichoic acid export membrane protein